MRFDHTAVTTASVQDWLRSARATLADDDLEAFSKEVRLLVFEAAAELETSRIPGVLPPEKIRTQAGQCRRLAESIDVVALERGGMPHLAQLDLITLLEQAADALESADSRKPSPQAIRTGLTQRLALLCSIKMNEEQDLHPVAHGRIDEYDPPPAIAFINSALKAIGTETSINAIRQQIQAADFPDLLRRILSPG